MKIIPTYLKACIFCIFFCFAAAGAYSQEIESSKLPIQKGLTMDSLLTMIVPVKSENKFLFQNPLGKVYAMSPDNMPCLAPHSLHHTPVIITPSLPYMPNPIPMMPLLSKPLPAK